MTYTYGLPNVGMAIAWQASLSTMVYGFANNAHNMVNPDMMNLEHLKAISFHVKTGDFVALG